MTRKEWDASQSPNLEKPLRNTGLVGTRKARRKEDGAEKSRLVNKGK